MYSKISIFILAVIFVLGLLLFGNWSAVQGGGDSWGYYGYLPAAFIHHDLGTLEKSIATRHHYHVGDFVDNGNPLRIDEAKHLGEGRQVMKYPLGMAALMLPFFLLAHFLALISHFPADGYSPIYSYIVNFSSIFYVLFGLIFLRKVLLRYFDDSVVAMLLLCLGLVTNILYFCTFQPIMAHNFIFGLSCLLIWATLRFYDSPSYRSALLIGLSAGLIALCRPTGVLILAIPFAWGITGFASLKKRIFLLLSHWRKPLLAAAVYATIGSLQLLYWKWATGSFLFYSYQEEGFDFSNPYIYEGLFGYKNGWLTYTPLMIISLLGIFLLIKKQMRVWLLPILLFLPAHIYVIYSWHCWNYINGFGSRPMIEAYALLVVPLGMVVSLCWKRAWLKWPLLVLLGGLLWLNAGHTYLTATGGMISSTNNKAYFWRVLGQFSISYDDFVVWDTEEHPPDTSTLRFDHLLYENDFNDSLNAHYYCNKMDSVCVDYHFYFNGGNGGYAPGLSASCDSLGLKGGEWLRLSIKAKIDARPHHAYEMATLVTHFYGGTEKWQGLKLENKIQNDVYGLWTSKTGVWAELHYWTEVPPLAPGTQLKVYVWRSGANGVHLDDMRVRVYSPK